MRVCAEAGCPELVEQGRCQTHEAPIRAHQRRHYTGIPGVNYGRRWQRAAKQFLADHPWCAQPGCMDIATEVDHIVPHKGDYTLFWDLENNVQGLCVTHHSAKTMREVQATR